MSSPSDLPVRLGPDERTLDELLALDVPAASLSEDVLQWIAAPSRALPLQDTPPLLLRVHVLTELDAIVAVHDVGRFLEEWPEEVGAYAEPAVSWCEEMGATRAAELLRRAIALLPGGRVPTEFTARSEAVDAVREAADADPFEALGTEYADALPELAVRLRDFLRARRDDVLRELAGLATQVAERDSASGLLALDDDMAFLEALDAAVERVYPEMGDAIEEGWDAAPPARRVTLWCMGAYLYGTNDGAWKILDTSNYHELWDEAQRWCRAIGAERTAAYLAAVAAAFPDGMPEDKDELMDAVAAFEDEQPDDPQDPWSRIDALNRVDLEHAGALDDMVAALRDFVAANAADPVGAIDRLARGESVPAPRRTPRPPVAVERKVPTSLKHPVLDALFAPAHGFTRDDWARAVRERFAGAENYDGAMRRIMQAARDAAKAGTGAGGEAGRSKRQRWDQLAQPLVRELTAWLPKVHADAQGTLPLEMRAFQLLLGAQRAIMVREALGEALSDDVAVVLRPFGEAVVATPRHSAS